MRVFVAADVHDKDALRSIRGLQDGLRIKARPVPVENMHFTLQFLGEVAEDRIPQVCAALRAVAFSPLELEIRGVGAFPGPEAPRVVWVGTDRSGGEGMAELARSVRGALEPLGFPRNGTFKPHLTVLRIKDKIGDIAGELGRFGRTVFGRIVVSEIRLKQSRLTPSGPVYSDLEVVAAE